MPFVTNGDFFTSNLEYNDGSWWCPLNHKLGVIRTLCNHYDNIVTEEVDATKEIAHVNHALGACSYLSWSIKRVRKQLDQWDLKKNLKINKKDSKDK